MGKGMRKIIFLMVAGIGLVVIAALGLSVHQQVKQLNISLQQQTRLLADRVLVDLRADDSARKAEGIHFQNAEYFSAFSSLSIVDQLTDSVLYQYQGRSESHSLLFDVPELTVDIYREDSYWATLNIMLDTQRAHQQLLISIQHLLLGHSILFMIAIGIFWRLQQRFTKPLIRLLEHSNQLVRKYEAHDVEAADASLLNVNQALSMLDTQLETSHSECIRLTNYIRESTFHDQLTGLANRAFLHNRLNELLNSPEEACSGVLLLLQLKHYQSLSENLKLNVLQDVVQQTAILISNIVSKIDDAVLARVADDDFIILLPQYTDKQGETIAKKILSKVPSMSLPTSVDRDDFANIGIAVFQPEMHGYQVLSEADMALRAAQLQGANVCFMYSQGALEHHEVRGSVRWRVMLEHVIEKRALQVFLQKAVVMQSSEIFYHEALMRIKDEKNHWIAAGVFLPMAVRNGQIIKLDRMMLDNVMKLLQQAQYQAMSIAVNLSQESLMDSGFVSWLEKRMAFQRGIAKQLIVEVSEYAMHKNAVELRVNLQRLQQLGAKIVIDHVGEVLADYEYMEVFPPYALKLHSSLIRDIHVNQQNQQYVQGMVSLAAKLNCFILAEGVESENESNCLAQLGIYGTQGYYIEKPYGPVC